MNRLQATVATGLAALTLLAGAACSSLQSTPEPSASPASSETVTVSQPKPAGTAAASVAAQTQAARAQGEMSVVDLVKFAEPAVVRIETAGGIGSGFIIDAAGHIITNQHVVAGRAGAVVSTVSVTLSDGSVVQGKVLGTDARSDLALISITTGTKLKALDLAKLEDVAIGQDVVAIGYALDLKGGEGPSFSVTRGIVSQKNRSPSDSSTLLGSIQTDAAINHGNSGGPLLNLFGQVVGVNQSLAPDATTGGTAFGIGFAVGADIIRAVYEELKTDGQVNRGLLGIRSFEALRPAKARDLGVPESIGGVYLGGADAVAPDGAAARGGLKAGDVITKIAGATIRTEADLAVQMIRNAPGTTIDLEVYRAGKKLTLSVTLGDAATQ